MKMFGALVAMLSAVGATLRRGLGFFRPKDKSINNGFHVRRDGRVIYHGRLAPEKFRKFGWGYRPRLAPIGCPKLTGMRLANTMKSCDLANLLVKPRYMVEQKAMVAGAA